MTNDGTQRLGRLGLAICGTGAILWLLESFGVTVAMILTPWGWIVLAGAGIWAVAPLFGTVVKSIEAFGVKLDLSRQLDDTARTANDAFQRTLDQVSRINEVEVQLEKLVQANQQSVSVTTGIDQDRVERLILAALAKPPEPSVPESLLSPTREAERRTSLHDEESLGGSPRGSAYVSAYLPNILRKNDQ